MFVDEQKMNENDESHLIIDDLEHRLCKLSLHDFVLNSYFRIESKINFMRLSSQHDFLQSFMTIYRRNYELQMMNFEKRQLR